MRLWPELNGLPSELRSLVGFDQEPLQSTWVVVFPYAYSRNVPARYAASIRTVLFDPGRCTVYALTHELAHAWDDVANDSRPLRRLDLLPSRQRGSEIGRLADEHEANRTYQSHRPRPRRRGAGGSSLVDMFDRYSQRIRGPYAHLDGFGSGGRHHDRRNVIEFYAEGYATFHSDRLFMQAKLYFLARELYDYLEDESNTHSVPIAASRLAVESLMSTEFSRNSPKERRTGSNRPVLNAIGVR